MKTLIIDEREKRKYQFWDEKDEKKEEELHRKGLLDIREEIGTLGELEGFSVIAVHESLLKETGRFKEVIDYAKKKQNLLVLFSGGITHNGIYDSGRLMKINAADFYNKVLLFVEENQNEDNIQQPLLHFLYGTNWKLPLLLRYRDLIWNYGSAIDDDSDKNPDYQTGEEIREILLSGDDAISLEWIEDELVKFREETL